MSGMDVARAVLVTYLLTVFSHPLVEDHRDVLQVEARYRPSIHHLCGPSAEQSSRVMWLTVRIGGGSDRDHNYLA